MARHLFLDLEDTCITPVVNGWANSDIINQKKIRKWIEVTKPDFVNIFSFAIWNQAEKRKFNNDLRPELERELGIKFNLVLTVDDNIIPTCCRVMGLHPDMVDFQEMYNFWGKQGAFRLFMQDFVKDNPTEFTLLDDVVFDEDINWPRLYSRGSIINIDQMYVNSL